MNWSDVNAKVIAAIKKRLAPALKADQSATKLARKEDSVFRISRPAILSLAIVVAAAVAGVAGWRHLHDRAASSHMAIACQMPDRSTVAIPAGTFHMGVGGDADDNVVVHEVHVAAFSIDRYAVTNAEFATFVAATGYVTDAEKKPSPEDYPEIPPDKLVAGGAVFTSPATKPDMSDETGWWKFVAGANWRHPTGPNSDIEDRENEPVVQVSYNDARAYAHWRGRELPTEEQFEYAARGGLDGKIYDWGDELTPGGKQMANTWQGEFPVHNTDQDGFVGVAPVGCFPANGYGLYDMAGNVWQWTDSHFNADDTDIVSARIPRVIKGGSYLCSSDFCRRYRPGSRQAQESSFGSVHLGFRTVGAQSKG